MQSSLGRVREDRVMLTLDLGISDIRTCPPAEHPGIVVLRPAHQDRASVPGIIRRLLTLSEEATLEGAFWIVDDQPIRIRK